MVSERHAVGQVVSGWATRSLEEALHAVVVRSVAVWQLVVVGAILMSTETASARVPLVAAHLAVALLAIATPRRVPPSMLIGALAGLTLVDWSFVRSIDGVLCLAAVWTCHLMQVPAVTLLRGDQRRVMAAVVGIGVPVAIGALHPEWIVSLAIPLAVAGLGIRRGFLVLLPRLEALTRSIDAAVAASWQEQQAVAVATAASIDASNHARILHDTVINTLGALASGGAAIRDPRLVSEVCERDARTVDALIDGSSVAVDVGFDELVQELGLTVRRHGLTDEAVSRVSALLPLEVSEALHGAVGEVVRNVAKHAGTDVVEVTVTEDGGRLAVTVADHGRGFDGILVPGRGLAESVVARCERVGVDVEVATRVGGGTSVCFQYVLTSGDSPAGEAPHDASSSFVDHVGAIRRLACWLWVAGVVVVGLIIELGGRPGVVSPTYVMLLTAALVGLVAWWDVRASGGPLRPAVTALVTASAPVVFLLALAGVDFGHGGGVGWHAIGVTAPLVILLVHAGSLVPLLVASAGVLAASVASTAVVAQTSTTAAALIPIGTAPALGMTAAWYVFHRTLAETGLRVAAAQRLAAVAAVERAARDAATSARERWRHAGLSSSRSLLRRIAEGSVDPTDATVRAICGQEEAFLRQLSLLDPQLFRMGYWFARALADGRTRDVRVVVRTGQTEVESDDVASSLGRLLVGVVGAAPTGAQVVASLFPTREKLRFSVVGPGPAVSQVAASWRPPRGWDHSTSSYGAHDLVEVLRADGPAAVSTDPTGWSGRRAEVARRGDAADLREAS